MNLRKETSTSEYQQVREVGNILRKEIYKVFTADEINYAYLAGSFTLGKDSSDIDMIVSINKPSTDINKVYRFVDTYLELHKQFGCNPDLDFPSDVISEKQITESLLGRGFNVKNNELYLKDIDGPEGFLDEDLDYRVYLWEFISSKNGFITGNFDKFKEDQKKAMQTIVNFTMKNTEQSSLINLAKNNYSITGMEDEYHVLAEDAIDLIKESYDSNIFTLEGSNIIIKDRNLLKEWEVKIVNRKNHNEFDAKPVFGDWNKLREYAKK